MSDTTVTTETPGQVASAGADIVSAPVAPTPASTPAPEATKPTEPSVAATPPKAELDLAAIKMPEGFERDEAQLTEFKKVFDEASKLPPQEAAQKFVDLYTNALKTAGEASTREWEKVNENWVTQVKADKDIGGDKLEPTRQSIAKVIDSLGADEAKAFREALDVTGAGNHPGLVKGLAKLAARLNEGGHVPGTPPSGKQQDTAAMFFPNSPEMK